MVTSLKTTVANAREAPAESHARVAARLAHFDKFLNVELL